MDDLHWPQLLGPGATRQDHVRRLAERLASWDRWGVPVLIDGKWMRRLAL